MQDIDFDEIDRAVNSITNTNPEVSTHTSSVINSAVVISEPATEPAVQSPTLAPSSPSPAMRRSSGRFMDVVHPSSDMRPATGDRPSASSAPSLHREEVAEREVVAVRPEPAATASAAFHWPDPIDLAAESTPAFAPEPVETISDATVEPAAEVVEEPAEPAAALDQSIEDDFEDEEEASPLESPFLTDAKVEKRPLGAFSGADADLPLLEDPIPFSINSAPQPEVVAEAEPEVVELAHEEHEETPHELHPELLALDGHGVDETEDEALLLATNPPDPIPTTVDAITAGPTSITQQYTEQPSTASQPSGSIFDTEAYHQPLTHTTKKRSGVLVAVWIVALILVGGGIGAGIYFVVLPMLG
ncbi:MAG TPA: hypothetical protein VIM31_00790 [Candidatus Microsaccharimonas sp.]|jgi:hypothetical protein